MTSSHHGPYVQGYTRDTMVATEGNAARQRKSLKATSVRIGVQLDSMKLESLVIVGQLYHGEYVPGPCTHRPSSHGSRGRPKSLMKRRRRNR